MTSVSLVTGLLLLTASLTVASVIQSSRQLTLEEILQLGSKKNLQIQAARYQAAALAEEVPKSYADFWPKLRGEYQYFVQSPRPVLAIPHNAFTVPPIPGIPALANGLSIPSQDAQFVAGRAWDYHLPLRIDQPLFTGFRLSSTYAIAQVDRDIGEVRLARAQQDIAEQVKMAYFQGSRGRSSSGLRPRALGSMKRKCGTPSTSLPDTAR